ncbi:MAG TPA: hypothetical protein VNW99_10400 [Cytophagaceae bacterium]|nr:hypothetical protein [Cytophagaceae bacterium]
MKQALRFIAATTLIFSCNKTPEGYTAKSFFTQDSLYKISLYLPMELDTFYTWTDLDDFRCADEKKYRFSKSSFPHYKETGFYSTTYLDSVYNLTIVHNNEFWCKEELGYGSILDSKKYVENLKRHSNLDDVPVKILEVKKSVIHDRDFLLALYQMNEKGSKYETHYLKGITLIDTNRITFDYRCRSSNCNKFIERMKKSIESVKIEKQKK